MVEHVQRTTLSPFHSIRRCIVMLSVCCLYAIDSNVLT